MKDNQKKERLAMGCLVKCRGVWHVRWRYEGRQFQRSTGRTKRTEALPIARDIVAPFLAKRHEDVAAALAGRVERAGREAAEAIPALTVADLWPAYERSPDRPDSGASSMRMYAFQVGRFVRWMSAAAPAVREAREVTPAIAARFLADLEECGMSANTLNKYRALLRRVWRCTRREARWTENPWEETRARAGVAKRRRALTPEEVRRLVETAQGEWRTLMLVGAYAGLRLGDAARLRAEDVRDGRICLTPRKTARKSGAEVRIPLHPRLAKALEETGVKAGPYMPTLAERQARNSAGISRQVQVLFRRAGIETTESRGKGKRPAVVAGFHSLRHTFVSRLADAGAPLPLVQALAGHSTPAMTAHYYHADDGRAAAAIAALDGPGVRAVAGAAQDRAARIAALEAELARLRAGG